ncbi:MAG: glycoside hydrolase family 9 protein [Oscillospiraceae bacterium]|nr:glycoside hydrolase family 9 protein [Oscillospiraceae bacterium]
MKHESKLAKRIVSGVLSAALLFSGTNLGFAKQDTVKAADNDNYAKLLQYSLYFYDANMCGDTSSGAMNWRGNCHMSDDVVGGYHDAGDHVMFGLPQGYACSTINWSYYEYKDVYASLGLTDHFKTITKHFTDFFKKSTEMSGGNVSRFLYQKGEGGPDHSYWGAPEAQGDRGKMYWVTSGASDIAAEYAAALALDYINFGDKESLDYAKALYTFSCRDNQCAKDGTGGFYDSENCADDQAWAAAWLYVATKEDKYLNDAKSKNTQYLGWAHAWGNVDLGAACVIAEVTNDWTKVNGYLGGKCNGSGYLCMDGWGSARYNCGMQFVSLVASKHSNADYSTWAKGQMDIILGANGGQNYVVGWNDKSPKYCHHRAASGVSDCHDASPNKYNLVGALVGGPNASGYYADKRDEYETNEVAIDYQANLVCAAAALYGKYKTGSTVTSIDGVGSVKPNPTTPEPTTEAPQPTQPSSEDQQPTTQATQPTTNPPVSVSDTDATVTEKTGDEGNTFWSVDLTNASKVTVTFKTETAGTEANGVFNPPGGWTPEDWSATVNGGTFTLTYDNTDNLSFIDIHVWWPQDCTVVSAVKTLKSGSVDPTEAPTTQPTTEATQPTTQPTSENNAQVIKYGDVNLDGKVDIIDVIRLNKYLLGSGNLDGSAKANADVDATNTLDATDSLNILKLIVEVINESSFPVR